MREIRKVSLNDNKNTGRFNLNIKKGQIFKVLLKWNCDDDLDAHALRCEDDGNGPKIYEAEDILSTFNVKRRVGRNNTTGIIERNNDGSFETPCGSLHHSGDALTGSSSDAPDEVITINTSKVPDFINSIPIFVSIYDEADPLKTLKNLNGAEITITDNNGNAIVSYLIDEDYEKFNVLQFGPIELGNEGWEFNEKVIGSKGTFAEVIDTFWAE